MLSVIEFRDIILGLVSGLAKVMREGDIHLIEAHVSGYCFDGDRILAVKRTPKRKIYPKLWETGGKSIEKLDKLDFIPGVREDIAKAWKQLKSKSK